MFQFFLSQKHDFFGMLHRQAMKTEEGLASLAEFMEKPTPENGKSVSNLENEADEIRRVLIDSLNRTFVTPIDREDIFSLSQAIDDVIDYAKSTVEETLLFETEPDVQMREMVGILHEASKDVAEGVKHIQDDSKVCVEHVIRAKKAENKIERLYRRGLVELFQTKDVIKILKSREIYRHLSNAADRIVMAANIIGDILIKYS